MDKITKSLHGYLKNARIKYKAMFNTDAGNQLEEQTSTVFHVTRKIDEEKMSVLVDVYPKDNTVYLSAYPWCVFSDERMEELKEFENKWNGIEMFSTLSIEEERGVIEPDSYCFHLTSRILAEKDGLSRQLWKKYLELLIKETLDAWEMFEKIINPSLFDFMLSSAFGDETDVTFQAYSFN